MNHALTSNRIYRRNRRFAWLALLFLVAIGLALVITPIWIIQPFKPQTPRGLEVSYAMRQLSPLTTIAASVLVILLAAWLWRRARWFGKVLLVLLSLPLFAATWMARQNHFEWLFRPHGSVAYAAAGAADHVNDSDMVLAVTKNGEAAAYPVRLMAYHHLVQDVVGGTPIVATY
jgi:hypothetical protein